MQQDASKRLGRILGDHDHGIEHRRQCWHLFTLQCRCELLVQQYFTTTRSARGDHFSCKDGFTLPPNRLWHGWSFEGHLLNQRSKIGWSLTARTKTNPVFLIQRFAEWHLSLIVAVLET